MFFKIVVSTQNSEQFRTAVNFPRFDIDLWIWQMTINSTNVQAPDCRTVLCTNSQQYWFLVKQYPVQNNIVLKIINNICNVY